MYTIIHAILGYWFLLLTVRVLTRRPGAQMTPFEFVLVFLVGGVAILSTVGNDRSETNSVCAVMAVALMHRSVSWLTLRFPRFNLFAEGTPLVVLQNGRWNSEVLNRMKIQDSDVMAAARSKGIKTLSDIEYAVLERNGAISIIRRAN